MKKLHVISVRDGFKHDFITLSLKMLKAFMESFFQTKVVFFLKFDSQFFCLQLQ